MSFVAQAWAGPGEEVAQISGARGQAFEEGTRTLIRPTLPIMGAHVLAVSVPDRG